ncbi:hypothetical protein [Wukongibacter sp. M2B1]|uniref:hypothetical protein n=1 Tax=Wukongibacter sp. M2B1 TaxID=3088895 RepID=UPI003D7BA9EC
MDSYKRRRDRENKQVKSNNIELATVTSPDTGQGVNAQGVGEYREIPLVAPFGIRWNPPLGQNIQLIKNWNNGKAVVAVGTIVDQFLEPGESELFSIGGASIKCKANGEIEAKANGGATIECKSNGSVVINSLVEITKEGIIKAIDFESTVHGGVYYG